MRGSRYRNKPERGAEMLLTPYNMLGLDIGAPHFTSLDRITKPSDHSSGSAAEIQYPAGRVNEKIGLAKYALHYVKMLLPRI